MSKDEARIPVTLLTGFLGSGKTTVVNRLVQQPRMAGTLVIVNEFGDIGLDHMLVAHSSDGGVVEMSGGCLCCTVRSDLIKTLRDIVWRFARGGKRQFDRVLIETTGLADPVSILHAMMTHPYLAARYRLQGVATTVDMASAGRTLDAHPECARQIAVADRLLLTKNDLALPQEVETLMPRLQAINPMAERVQVTRGDVDAEAVLTLEAAGFENIASGAQAVLDTENCDFLPNDAHSNCADHTHDGHSHHAAHPHERGIRAYTFVAEEPIVADSLHAWLNRMAMSADRRILRVKGMLNIAGQPRPMVIHAVQHLFHEPFYLERWPSDDRRSRCVFITQDLDRDAIAQTFGNLGLAEPASF